MSTNRIQPPKTHLEDLQAYIRKKDELNISNTAYNGTKKDFYKQLAQIKKEFEGRVFPEDEYLFDNHKNLVDFLNNNNLPISEWVRTHEPEHGKEASIRGLSVQYGCMLVLVDDQIGYLPFVRTKGFMTMKDILAVSSAPGESSELDKELRKTIEESAQN